MFWKFFMFRKVILVRVLGAALAVLISLPILHLPVAKAEQSDAAIQAEKKRKLRRLLKAGKPVPEVVKPAAGHSAEIKGQATTKTEVVSDENVAPMLSPYGSQTILAAEDKYAAMVDSGGWPAVPKGTYKKGNSGAKIAILNQRLFIEGYLRKEGVEGEFAEIYTSATKDAVRRFQQNHGLAATGKVDGPTLRELNVPAADRLATIRANIYRIEEYSKGLGNRYIVVNVPAQQIETVSNGRVFSKHNAIVGRPERPTPVVITAISDINFNPYWNAPPSIIERDLIPKMLSGGTKVLQDMNIRVFKGFGGPEIDPAEVDWSTAVADDYHFRQEPGGKNAMATAKINFSSPFGIYLHDTPEPQLFQSGSRFYSSGCVRVQEVAIFLNWILNGQDGFNPSRIEELAQSLERLDVKVIDPPQLRVAYLTAWPTSNGTVAFRDDIYDLDGTGFVVGQPMPVGEMSDAGERFVLKPIPRQVAAIEENEAEGFSLFGKRSGKRAETESIASTTAPGSSKKTAKSSTSVSKKSDEKCKIDKNGKLQKDCKVPPLTVTIE